MDGLTGNRRGIADRGRAVLVLLIDLLDGVQVEAVVLEDHHVLALEVVLEVEGVVGGGDVLKGRVDEALQRHLEVVDVDVELEDVAVKLVSPKVEQVVGLALDVVHDVVERLDHLVQAVDVRVLRQAGELMDGGEHVDELPAPLGEEVELAEDRLLVKVKLATFRVLCQLVAGDPVLLLVGVVELDCRLQVGQELRLVLIPELPGRHDLLLALGDHLVGDLAEELRHALAGVVIPRDGVHHLDVVHEHRQAHHDLLEAAAGVHGLHALLKGHQVFDVVLGLIGRVRHADVQLLPDAV
eukprot:scaffold253275_cov43-Prasinocladus_malaysianus.AAC.5